MARLRVRSKPDLPERIRAGDMVAMEEAFVEHLDDVYNYCYRRTGSWTVAEDLSATVFLEAWRSRRRAAVVDDTLLPWLYGVAANVCRHHHRSAVRRDRAVRRLQVVRDTATGSSDVGDLVATEEWLARTLAELPARDQDAFILVCWQDLTYEQASAALSVPIGTIRSRVHRARQHLRRVHRSTGSTHPTEETHHA